MCQEIYTRRFDLRAVCEDAIGNRGIWSPAPELLAPHLAEHRIMSQKGWKELRNWGLNPPFRFPLRLGMEAQVMPWLSIQL